MSGMLVTERSQKSLDSRIDQISQPLINGQLTTIEQYRHQCGYIQGLRDAKILLSEVYKTTYESQTLNSEKEGGDGS